MIKKTLFVGANLILAWILTGCLSTHYSNTNTEGTWDQKQFNSESWRTLIPESCNAFFDGCNQCMRNGTGEDIACTLQYCENYEEPRCIDNDEVSSEELSNTQETILSGDEYLWLTEEEATELATNNQTTLRVVERDWVSLPVTMDLRPGRINAKVESGSVVSVEIE